MTPDTPHLLPSLFIGVPSIDKEHDELVAQLIALLDERDLSKDNERFSALLSRLGGQLVNHFANEERFFKSLAMPANEITGHVQAHIEILDQYTQINLDLMEGKALDRASVLHKIKDWIVGHIVSFDLNIKKYLPTTELPMPVTKDLFTT